MVASVSEKIFVPVHMDLVGHCVKIELVQFTVKMVESALCQEINANAERGFTAQGATKGNITFHFCKQKYFNVIYSI
jgi:hypothetical protein